MLNRPHPRYDHRTRRLKQRPREYPYKLEAVSMVAAKCLEKPPCKETCQTQSNALIETSTSCSAAMKMSTDWWVAETSRAM